MLLDIWKQNPNLFLDWAPLCCLCGHHELLEVDTPVPISVEDAENLTQAHNCRLGDEISFAKNS